MRSYAKLLTLQLVAYGKMGRITITDGKPNMDKIFLALESWMKNNRKFLGESDLSEIRYRYEYLLINMENNASSASKSVEIDKILSDLKKIASPTSQLAQDCYLTYLEDLLREFHGGLEVAKGLLLQGGHAGEQAAAFLRHNSARQ